MNVTESEIVINAESKVAELLKKSLGLKGHVSVFYHGKKGNVTLTFQKSPAPEAPVRGQRLEVKQDSKNEAEALKYKILSQLKNWRKTEFEVVDQKHIHPYTGWAVKSVMLTSKLHQLMVDLGVEKEYKAILEGMKTEIAEAKKNTDKQNVIVGDFFKTVNPGTTVLATQIGKDFITIEFSPAKKPTESFIHLYGEGPQKNEFWRKVVGRDFAKQLGIPGVSVDSSNANEEMDRFHVNGVENVGAFIAMAEDHAQNSNMPTPKKPANDGKKPIVQGKKLNHGE